VSRRTVAALVAIGAPLLIGAAIAAVVALVSGGRMLVVSLALPVLPIAAGVVVAAIAALIVAVRASRRRTALRVEAAFAAGRDAAVAAEHDARRRFLARLDHELKNPVTAIRATLAGAADPLEGPLAVVDAQARRLAALVGDLRKLSELETRPLESEPVVLEELLADAVAAATQQHPGLAGRIGMSVSRVPWPVPVLSADPDLLALAVDNVIANAVKFGGDGPIEVRLREEGGWAVVEVADTGRGVPAGAQPHVFDELARAENARDVPGSGIGLSLVRTILRRHGGDAELRSREGEGTVVTLRLPTPR